MLSVLRDARGSRAPLLAAPWSSKEFLFLQVYLLFIFFNYPSCHQMRTILSMFIQGIEILRTFLPTRIYGTVTRPTTRFSMISTLKCTVTFIGSNVYRDGYSVKGPSL